jgi:hypothetical protein
MNTACYQTVHGVRDFYGVAENNQVKEMGHEGRKWVLMNGMWECELCLVQDRDEWRALMNMKNSVVIRWWFRGCEGYLSHRSDGL